MESHDEGITIEWARILLQIAGHHVTSASTARRHIRALTDAASILREEQLQTEAKARIDRLEAKWGSAHGTRENPSDPEPLPIAEWLATRTHQRRTFLTIQQAAKELLAGETSLTRVRNRSFAIDGSIGLVAPVRYEPFKNWLLRCGIARRTGAGRFLPGINAVEAKITPWPEMAARIEKCVPSAGR